MSIEFFAINISSSQLKVSFISKNKDKYRLEALGSFSLTKDGNQVNSIFNSDTSVIIDNLKKLGIRCKNVVLTIPEDKVITRIVTLPYLQENEIEDAIYFSFKSMIPVDIESQNITFIPVLNNTTSKKISYYTVSIHKDEALNYYNYLAGAGLNLLAIETEVLSNHRAIMHNEKTLNGESFIIVDIGSNSTTMSLNTDLGVLYSQQIPIGGRAMTKLIAADFGIDIVQAEQLKINNGLDFSLNEGKIANSIKPVVDTIVSEVSKLIAYHKDKVSQVKNLKTGFLVGGGSNLRGLDSFLSQVTNVLFVKCEPLKNIEVPKKLQSEILTKVNHYRFTTVIGANIKNQ
jgi:type IV pilus assembly protein PilM